MLRAAAARARQLAERICRPLGLRFVARVYYISAVVDVPYQRGKEAVIEELARGGERGGLRWIGYWGHDGDGVWGCMPTRDEVRDDTRERCRWATVAHDPGCECDRCGVQF